ncbi:peptide chain release factor 2 [Candidatus Saccharibacteria bacterium]|nr:peptide chain release factor 2 [Candidatus Saccharibacteria bacterium]
MQPLLKRSREVETSINLAYEKLAIDQKIALQQNIEEELARPDAWSNSDAAQTKSKELAKLQTITEPWIGLKNQLTEVNEFIATEDETLTKEVEKQLDEIEQKCNTLKKQLRFQGKYDDHNAILRLSAGVGGTDAADFTEMLERMYLRWAEKNEMKTAIIERSPNEEAGIKSSVIEVNGAFAYGKLKSEHGVHRLVRLSPFNSDNLRQTSFALVEVLPDIDTPDGVNIDEKDLKIDVFRAGGHGGQSVNTTDSAVRITHSATGIVVSIQNERSQLQNRETAMKVLRSKLAQLQIEQHAEKLSDLKAGESANWGSQIRNYVLHPYTMVKDTRTKHEERDAQSVLDGKIDGFIEAYLENSFSSE